MKSVNYHMSSNEKFVFSYKVVCNNLYNELKNNNKIWNYIVGLLLELIGFLISKKYEYFMTAHLTHDYNITKMHSQI